jgi:hypothetical protein
MQNLTSTFACIGCCVCIVIQGNYLCNNVSFLIFFISASDLVSGMSGRRPLLSNEE